MIRAADVRVGDFYKIRSGAVVQIQELLTSCVWQARNVATGREGCIVLGDLVEHVPKPQEPIAASSAVALPWWLRD